jgi:Protein of unknown function (DUF3800)
MAIFASNQRVSPPLESITDIYIDESSQTKNKFLVIGGISLPTIDVEAANECLGKARLPQLPHGEMKWGKVSNAKLPAYGRKVKAFFDERPLVRAHFHCLVVDTHEVNHHKHNQGSREIGFNKEIYQLASKFARLYPDRLFHLYPDYRDTNQTTDDLRLILNRGRAKKGDKRDWPFRRCHFRDSKTTPLLQLVDLLTGSVAWCVNGHGKSSQASPSKNRLSEYTLSRAGVADCQKDTAMSGKFTIWHRQLRG